LQSRHPLVNPDLLHIALHLLRPRLPGGDAHRSPHIVGHQNRQGLGGAASGADGSGIVDLQILSAVIVLAQVHPGDSLHGGSNHSLGQQCHGCADGVFHRLDLG